MGFSTRSNGAKTSYFPTGKYTDKLAAGIYTIHEAMFIGPYLDTLETQTDELLDMPGTAADDVMSDVRQFLSKRAEFEKYGFTHKRGYLMYGPPGTGKSSIAQLCARRFVQDDGLVIMAEACSDLPMAVDFVKANDPGRNLMVIIEDPDEEDLDDTEVLSVLDGTKAVAGLVTIVTTNHKSKMSPRIANRPGRFDRVVRVDRISPAIQRAFVEQLEARDPSGPKVSAQLVKVLEGLPLTLAHLKEAFLAHVLLDVPLKTVRERFERMAKTGDQEGDDNEVEASPEFKTSGFDNGETPASRKALERLYAFDAKVNNRLKGRPWPKKDQDARTKLVQKYNKARKQ
jgi:SpoVK/Ycf46/Vps4 family AAA+-type ATPase